MNYPQMQVAMPSPEQLVQRHLENLVEKLGWSYVALWSLNHQTRNLGWEGGHFRVNPTAVSNHGGAEVWNEQLFDSTYKSCHFTCNLGSVGTAHAEGRDVWMNGPSVIKHAGTQEQAQFLQHARIATVLCIPWTGAVLELGTCESVPESRELVENIRQFVLKQIVPALDQPLSGHRPLLGVSQAPLNFPQSSLASRSMMQQHAPFSSLNPLRTHMSENFSNPAFEPNSLNQQIRRTASLSSLNTDMFLQQLEDGSEGKDQQLDTDMLLSPDSRTWKLSATTGAPELVSIPATATANDALQYYPPAQQSARGQYRSRTSTTSSSLSSLDDGSAKHSVDSPEQNNMAFFGASSQRKTSHSNTSSSPRRGTSSHSPEMNQFEDVASAKTGAPLVQESTRVDDDIQRAISLMLEDQESWRGLYSPLQTGSMCQVSLLESCTNGNHSNSSITALVVGNEAQSGAKTTAPSVGVQTQGPFKSWRHTRILAPILQKHDRTNQELLRRCIDMMKQIPNLQQAAVTNQTEAAGQPAVRNVAQQGPRAASSSSPETARDVGISYDPFDQPRSLRVQRRPRGGSRIASMGPVHTGHEDAAMNHMMAERRRRVKQKENFTALRRLVPIISKADKASILGDAIVYVKDLQEQIRGLEASRNEAQRRFEGLQVSYKDLEQRHKDLEAMVGSSGSLPQRGSTRGLHSIQSL